MINLIIVNCQNDFITGTVLVKGAKNTVDNIKKFINKNKKEIEKIIFTVDWHPYNHCSFKKYGGTQKSHCVQYTPGACIEPKLLKLIQSLEMDYEVVQSGVDSKIEQMSSFIEIEHCQDFLGSYYYLDKVKVNSNSDCIICGIAGDSSIKETIKNLMDNNITPKIFQQGIISTDGGKIFSQFVKENSLEKVTL